MLGASLELFMITLVRRKTKTRAILTYIFLFTFIRHSRKQFIVGEKLKKMLYNRETSFLGRRKDVTETNFITSKRLLRKLFIEISHNWSRDENATKNFHHLNFLESDPRTYQVDDQSERFLWFTHQQSSRFSFHPRRKLSSVFISECLFLLHFQPSYCSAVSIVAG